MAARVSNVLIRPIDMHAVWARGKLIRCGRDLSPTRNGTFGKMIILWHIQSYLRPVFSQSDVNVRSGYDFHNNFLFPRRRGL